MKLFIYDTETTGILNKHLPLHSELQPRVLQLFYMQVEDGLVKSESKHNIYIKPIRNGGVFKIPDESTKVHGLTHEFLIENGQDWDEVYGTFLERLALCDLAIGHNVEFDTKVITGDLLRTWSAPQFPVHVRHFCTMHATTDILKLPGKFSNYKWPKLIEAHEYFFGCQAREWHDAMADVEATYELFCKLQEMGLAPTC